MRYLVLTDIHANLEALDVCLVDAAHRGYDGTLLLGDVVGYGPDPNAVVERVQALVPTAVVRGNHDKIALSLHEADGFHSAARAAAQWTLDALTPAHRNWLAALPKGPLVVDDDLEICHGSPFDEDVYIFDELDALRALKASRRQLCLFGHTHYRMVFELSDNELSLVSPDESVVELKEGRKYLVNPGSVGQPRDNDPRAAYAIYDAGIRSIDLVRLEYPMSITQQKMLEAGLPEVLARRLSSGR